MRLRSLLVLGATLMAFGRMTSGEGTTASGPTSTATSGSVPAPLGEPDPTSPAGLALPEPAGSTEPPAPAPVPADASAPAAPTTTAGTATSATTRATAPTTTTTTRPKGITPSTLLPRLPAPGMILGNGQRWRVSATAAPGGDGSADRPFRTIAEGLALAQPGDAVVVGPGTYRDPVVTVRAGRVDAPIYLAGEGARLEGNGDGRLLQILHSHVTLQGFHLTGANHLLWVQGARGVRILQNRLSGAGGECMRLKYLSSGNEVGWNHIEDCGRRGFNLSTGKKNGEGIYIGTAPEQLDRNPTTVPDASDDNWVHDNVISARAECVDVKEAATGNRIEGNTCSGSQDPEGAGFSSRGRATVFSENVSTGAAGAGIRLGGDSEADGILSVVRLNRLTGNKGYGVKVQRQPQALICGNDTSGNGQGPSNAPGDPAQPC